MKNRNFVNLNVNPCKMCMPIGASIALKGITGTMVMMHGSQGCSTYIRRHLTNHYNEPIDIASSSLNEKDTVYGGEENLKQGLRNVIKLYQPEIIGVVTTCLAETIGEDIARLVQEFVKEEKEEMVDDISFVSVSTPGYGGSQFEGYYLTLRKVVESITQESDCNEKINIIAGSLTPADIREIKRILNLFSVNYTILPDISATLDAPYTNEYEKLPKGGTSIAEIKNMGGAVATIEMGALVNEEFSPGKFLKDEFGVPCYRLPLPVGLKGTDRFINLIAKITNKKIPTKLKQARGRMLDGMIDSHKYNGQGRAAIFGEPELVYALSRLCLENGVVPALIATGTKTERLKQLLQRQDEYDEEEIIVLNDTDFETIRDYAKKLDINILLGSSNGSFITEKEDIPLVRVGFPIHDRVGAQRKVCVGYEGSLRFLDEITNTILTNKLSSYREDMFIKYFDSRKV